MKWRDVFLFLGYRIILKKYVNYNRSPLHLAVAANHVDIVQHLLNEGAKLQMFDKDSRSCLIIVRVFGFYLL